MNCAFIRWSRFAAAVTAIGWTPLLAQSARDRAVEVTATVQETPPQIVLQWNAASVAPAQQKVYRRLKGASAWSEIASPANAATSLTDTAVSPGVGYEYFVYRVFNGLPSTACGYLSAGIRAPLTVERGKVILLVDNTLAAALAAELAQWQSDLTGDGWTVARQDVSRTATVTSIRGIIQGLYAADPAGTVALILFGHIPVAYSGDFAADGHPEHYGAWPADVYYADLDGVWTDSTINDSGATGLANRNIPGDGKFDQSVLPSDVELQTGRIDLANLPAFSLSETELLRQYLNRDHAYRFKTGAFASVPRRGLVDDNFGFFNGEAFAASAWRSFTACCGSGNVANLDWFTTLQTQNYLWAYGCGSGGFTSVDGVGTTQDFATHDSRAVFNVLFGSWFGDWDNQNNVLRAPLAGRPGSLGLTSCFGSRPHWVFHQMALGETIGYCTRLSQNNAYRPGSGYDSNNSERFVHIALMGDPTLRLYPVAPATGLSALAAGGMVTLNWTASTDSPLEGYVVSRAPSPSGPFVRVRGDLAIGTTYTDRTVTPGSAYTYMVRAVKRETSPGGTYLNPSQGAFSTAVTAAAASGPEINVSGLGNSITAGDATALTLNGTDFGTAEIAQGGVLRTFTIANPGTTTLALTSFQIAGSAASDFVVASPPPPSVAAGGSAIFQLRFLPSATGLRAATLTLTSNDADEGSFQFALSGTGQSPHASIAFQPPSMSRSIHAGDAVTETLNLSNPGPGTLTHTVSSSLTRYSFRDSDSSGGPAYNWVEISASGTRIPGWTNADDDLSAPISLGFNFPFYGNNFSTVRVCTNGYLTFTDSISYGPNSILPNLSASANMIAPFWNDLVVDAAAGVFWQNVGGNFVVQFNNAPLYGNPATRVTCQVILKPTGEILLQYKALTQSGNNYTVGIQNGSRDDGLLIALNTAYVHPGLAVRITPPGLMSWLSLGATSGNLAPGGTQQIPVTLNAAVLPLGDYSAELSVAGNAASGLPAVIPVRLTVGNTPVENWRLSRFQTTANAGMAADTANPDGDALINLLEYALVSEPLIADSTAVLPATAINSSGYLQLRFTRHAARTDLRYIVEGSASLNSQWTPIASSIHGAPTLTSGAHSITETGAGDVKTVTVEDSSPASAFTRRFLRLSVVRD